MAQWSEPTVRDDDRLPWLESAEDEYVDGPAWQRVAVLVALGLALIAAVVLGISWFKNRAIDPQASGELIAAPAGDYKVKPENPGGMKVDGEGTTALATSQGKAGGAAINLDGAPETPVVGKKAAAGAAPKVETKGMTVPASGGKLAAVKPTAGAAASGGGASGGSLVQIGSFPTEAAANSDWATKSRRFAYLAPLGKSVEKAEVNERTVYRLRVNAGSAGAAQTLCGKLKVAGEACFIPN